jgi:hypothetical protein
MPEDVLDSEAVVEAVAVELRETEADRETDMDAVGLAVGVGVTSI